jgi:gamma-D-glutamyl-L-lysine dipeptidyl-peptidase
MELTLNFRYLISLLLLGSLTVMAQEPVAPPDEVTAIIKAVGQSAAPDRRLAVFAITAEMRGDTVVVRGETTVTAACDSLRAAFMRAGISPLRCQVEMLPHASLGDRTCGVINVSTASLYSGPHYDREIVNQGLLGEPVTILRDLGLFTHVQLSDGYVGYISGSITAMTPEELAAWQQRPMVIYMKHWGEVHSEKKESSYPVADIVLGASVALVKKEGKWLRVATPDGREGYLHRDDVMEEVQFKNQKKPTPEELVHTARQFTGYPYLWGGFSSKGLDCSGFTKTVYKMHGITLPRDANMQVNAGKAVTLDSTYAALQPGDLLFFGRSARHITHVGMYIGGYRFIHASDWVLINSLNPKDPDFNAHRVRDLQAVRRIL